MAIPNEDIDRETWIGMMAAIKRQFGLDFEGGEAESCVLNMPEYSSRIDIDFDIESEGEFRHLMRNVVVK